MVQAKFDITLRRAGLILGILTATFSIVSAQSNIKLEIGARLPQKYIGDSSRVTSTAAAQLRPFIEVTIKDVDYLIAYEAVARKIKYIFTQDDDFVSSEGLKVDEEITVAWKDVEILDYFQLRARAGKDGWQPVIGNSFSFEGKYLENARLAGKVTSAIDGFAKGYN